VHANRVCPTTGAAAPKQVLVRGDLLRVTADEPSSTVGDGTRETRLLGFPLTTRHFRDPRGVVRDRRASQTCQFERIAGRSIKAPRRNNSAHLHRLWRATYARARCHNRRSSKVRCRATKEPTNRMLERALMRLARSCRGEQADRPEFSIPLQSCGSSPP
jgi:hypothetical protein